MFERAMDIKSIGHMNMNKYAICVFAGSDAIKAVIVLLDLDSYSRQKEIYINN